MPIEKPTLPAVTQGKPATREGEPLPPVVTTPHVPAPGTEARLLKEESKRPAEAHYPTTTKEKIPGNAG